MRSTTLGYVRSRPWGAPEDLVTAYAWAKIAYANGNKGAPKFKLLLEKEMTPNQITKGETLSKEMIAKKSKVGSASSRTESLV